MPINSVHPEYSSTRTRQWTRCRDVVEGGDQVKSKGKEYLPILTDQSTTEYNAYKDRAVFFGISGRILHGLVSIITQKQPDVQAGSEMMAYFEQDPAINIPFFDVFKYVVSEILTTGRVGMLVDMPRAGGDPYFVKYPTEDILNWYLTRKRDEAYNLILQETVYKVDAQDSFVQEEAIQYRHLFIDTNGVYTVRVYSEDDLDTPMFTATPRKIGGVMGEIPFVCVNMFGAGFTPFKPPLLDIVDINLSHYRTSADLEHGRHFTALPTPVITGAPSDTKLKIGSNTAWVIPDHRAKASYLEFKGEGLSSLENALKEKHAQITEFSLRLMDTSKRGSEAEEVIQLRYAAESATIRDVAIAAEIGINRVYNYIAKIKGLDPVQVTLDKDFLSSKLTHQELKELTNAFVQGSIDADTLAFNLRRGGITPPKPISGGNEDA